MKRLFFALCMLILSTEFTISAPAKVPQCGDFDQVIEFLVGLDFQPIMGANSKAGRIVVFVNQDGFIVLENIKDEKLCVIVTAKDGMKADRDALFMLLGREGTKA